MAQRAPPLRLEMTQGPCRRQLTPWLGELNDLPLGENRSGVDADCGEGGGEDSDISDEEGAGHSSTIWLEEAGFR